MTKISKKTETGISKVIDGAKGLLGKKKENENLGEEEIPHDNQI